MEPRLRTWEVRATIAIVGLSVLSTLLGLFRAGHYNDSPALVDLYRVQDAAILLVGAPLLAVGLWYAVRGSLRGRLVWLGGLAYMSYTWASVGLQVSFNELFLLYVAAFGLSAFTLVSGLLRTDAAAIQSALEGRISERFYSGLLVVIGLGLAGLWLSEIVAALLAGEDPLIVQEIGQQAMVSHFVDLSVVVPSLLLSALWLSRGRAWGYVSAGVVLLLGASLGVGIAGMTLLIVAGDAVSISPIAVVFTFVPVGVAGLLAIRYVTAIPRKETGRVTDERDRGQTT